MTNSIDRNSVNLQTLPNEARTAEEGRINQAQPASNTGNTPAVRAHCNCMRECTIAQKIAGGIGVVCAVCFVTAFSVFAAQGGKKDK